MSSDANPALGSTHPFESTESPSTNPTTPSPSKEDFNPPPLKSAWPSAASSAIRRDRSSGVATASVALPPSSSNDLQFVAEQQAAVGDFVHKLQAQIKQLLADQVTPMRLAGHLSVLVVAAIILVLSQVKLPEWNISLDALPNSALGSLETGAQPKIMSVNPGTGASDSLNGSLQQPAVPFTVVKQETAAAAATTRQNIEVYVAKKGDTVLGIAEKFGLQPETIMWANADLEQNPDRLQIGQQLNILPVNGVLHIVKPGETLSSLAEKYKVEIAQIIGYQPNNLPDAAAPIKVGSQLVVPGGTKPFVQQAIVTSYSGPVDQLGSGEFSWPTVGEVSQGYWGGHPAIDVASWIGAPVRAADSGVVVEAGGGWSNGYGNHVIIDHGNGFATLYAHLTSIYVKSGESVARGANIGTVGNTGNSTGPHLHFEIRYQGVPRNPFNWLP